MWPDHPRRSLIHCRRAAAADAPPAHDRIRSPPAPDRAYSCSSVRSKPGDRGPSARGRITVAARCHDRPRAGTARTAATTAAASRFSTSAISRNSTRSTRLPPLSIAATTDWYRPRRAATSVWVRPARSRAWTSSSTNFWCRAVLSVLGIGSPAGSPTPTAQLERVRDYQKIR